MFDLPKMRDREPVTLFAAEQQLDLRERMSVLLDEHPEWDVPQALREIRTSLHLTQRDMARVGKISEPTLRNIEARRATRKPRHRSGVSRQRCARLSAPCGA